MGFPGIDVYQLPQLGFHESVACILGITLVALSLALKESCLRICAQNLKVFLYMFTCMHTELIESDQMRVVTPLGL